MREILFRGRRVDNGEWAYGFLTRMWGKYHIIDENNENVAYEIIPGTVGQYTGVIDKNGKKVFEGDVVEYAGSCGEIVFVERRGAFMSRERDMYCEWLSNLPQYGTGIVEIIGNIYDNKEILEGKE
nr:MAG TPA: YopX protein [Caudoviricetes sp.]